MENLNQQPNQTSELNQDSTAGPSEEKNRLMFWVTVLVIFFLAVVIGAVVWLAVTVGLTEKETETLMSNPGVIEGEHLIEDNRHVISGQIMVPNSCYNIDAEVKKDGGSSEKVRLDFYSARLPDGEHECLQMEMPSEFRVEFTAPPGVEIIALFNDEPVELRLERTLIKEKPAFLSEISPDYELDWQRLDSVDQTVGPPPHVTVIDPETRDWRRYSPEGTAW